MSGKARLFAAIPALLFALSAHAVELDPKAVVYTLPDNIKWVDNEKAGNAQVVIAGDPTKPGQYVVLTKWLAGQSFQPTALASERSLHHGHQGDVVGRLGRQFRSGERDRAAAGRHRGDALRQAGALRRRQG